jgi:hypothetical protein
MKALALYALLISGTLLCMGQVVHEPNTFFKIGLNDSQIDGGALIGFAAAIRSATPTTTLLFRRRSQLFERSFQMLELLPRLSEFAFRGQSLVVGKVFGGFCDPLIAIWFGWF